MLPSEKTQVHLPVAWGMKTVKRVKSSVEHRQNLGSTGEDQMKNVVRGREGWVLNRSAVLMSRRQKEIKEIGGNT